MSGRVRFAATGALVETLCAAALMLAAGTLPCLADEAPGAAIRSLTGGAVAPGGGSPGGAPGMSPATAAPPPGRPASAASPIAVKESDRSRRAADQRAHRRLSERIIHARFDETGLASALQSLERDYGLNMFVDWAALKGVGVGPGAPVNLDLRDVQVRTVLRAVLKCASGSTRNGALTFWVEDEVVEVSTRARADDMAYVVVYDCSDLIGGELPPRVADILSRLLMELDSSGDLRISSSDDTDYESRDD